MKNLYIKTSLWALFFSFILPTSAFARLNPQLKPLLPEKSLWSVVHDKPAGKNWTTTYPLPKDRKVRGGLDTKDGTWPAGKKYVFMTTELELPADYTPENLYVHYRHNDAVQIAINGTLVIQRVGAGRSRWGVMDFTKRVPNLLKPGKNIIAAYCENYGDQGRLSVELYTDDKPFMHDTMLFAPDGTWSFTLNNPGENWMMKNPLPGGKTGTAPFCTNTNGGWPKDKKEIWMTRVVTLPKEYKPGLLHVDSLCDDELWLYINGEEVLKQGTHDDWLLVKNIKNLLKPGKNIVAVRGLNHGNDGYIGVDLWLEEGAADDDDSGFSMPVRKPRDPEDVPEEQNLTDAEKLIEKGMNFLKQGVDKQAVLMLQEAAKTDPEDWQANCILGMLSLTKLYKPADAYAYMQLAMKAEPENPCVLNNYAVAAMEAKKYTAAIDAWVQVAADYPTLMELVQNVGFLTLLVDNNKIKITAAEQQKLEKMYREVCGTRNAVVDVNIGFLLMPPTDGVGSRMDCASAFVQEYKRGKDVIQGNPYEVKRTYFQK